ncbi:MAG TPA: hypothetical protein VFN30_13595 [Chitinophagaceae bacterium]|nr:hypothetical protein [Chitinophagaceae bacterium]
MKTVLNRILLTFLLFLFTLSYSNAQRFVVKIRPAAPSVVKIASPGARHVWIDGEWIWQGNGYAYKPGYWYLPKGREKWVPGHWQKTRRGWSWIPGHWKYRR